MPSSNERSAGDFTKPDTAVPTAFQHKGIGANLFLTAAAALVPIVILGVSAYATILDPKRSAKGRRSPTK